jgi:hypothetical protein
MSKQVPAGWQLDLLTAVLRLEQIAGDGGFYGGGPVEIVAERLLTCDLPRLRGYLTPETLTWAETQEPPMSSPPAEAITRYYAALAYDTWQQARGVPGASTWDMLPETARAAWVTAIGTVLAAVIPVIRTQERQ